MNRPTTIKSIKIQNIRGINERVFEFKTPEMLANRIHLLVAPNGFGKSSITHAFDLLKPQSLDKSKLERHKNDENLNPSVELTYMKDGKECSIKENEIRKHFSVSVIKSRINPLVKQANAYVGGKATAQNSLDDVRICSIPERSSVDYKKSFFKKTFGQNWNVLPDLSVCYNNPNLLERLLDDAGKFKLHLKTLWKSIEPLLFKFHSLEGTTSKIKNDFNVFLLDDLKQVVFFNKLADTLSKYVECSEIDRYLYALSFAEIAKKDSENLRKHLERCYYDQAKKEVEELIDSVNSNPEWLSIKLTSARSKGELVASFPVANHMSNGQRDLFSFLCQLIKAKFDLKDKDQGILIIDEVFDYLDDCNLLLMQYFVREFLDGHRDSGKELFPLIFTHLDPVLFNHQGLGKKNKINIHLLDNQHGALQSKGVAKLVKAREEEPAKEIIGKYFFHYEDTYYENLDLFRQKRLPVIWANNHDFYIHAWEELEKYRKGEKDVDLVAACVGLRLKIEKRAFDMLNNEDQRTKFKEECNNGTKSKLDYVTTVGIQIPESHRILGLIYNAMLHHKKNFDYISNIVSKMKNPSIRTMILKALKE